MSREVTLPVHIARRTPDPVFGASAQRHIFMVRAEDLPDGLYGPDANPRESNPDRGIYKDVTKHLLNIEGTPNTFHLKNKGITVVAWRVEKLTDDEYRIDFAETPDGQMIGGVVDGGHTYKLIRQAIEQIQELNDDESRAPVTQFVKLEVITGLGYELIPEIAGGLNTGIQVKKYSLANLRKEFEWIQGALDSQRYGDEIRYRENERKKIDIREILQLLECVNIWRYPEGTDKHPVKAYSAKESVVTSYTKDPGQYERLSTILPEALDLYDTIRKEGQLRRNEAGGKGGKMQITEKDYLCYLGETHEYALHRAAAMPVFAAFRALIEEGPDGKARWVGSFDNVLDTWRGKVGQDLVERTLSSSQELKYNFNVLGKSANLWAALYGRVQLDRLQRQLAQKGGV